ncbi:TetR/AcrR family transcriptional regulator [Saccharopolyspora halophila]|uniref:TetR/AcrR family transcriptional regulator n=1 Tax=Saccharopolyspora halophila TaxID=405551 RepID=A0ABN3GQR1_9PSEU
MTHGKQPLQPRKQPRQVRAELTRQRILTAAAHVFTEHGYAAGTTNRIAERAGVSIGSLYQYYPNKDALLAELLVRHLDIGIAATEEHRWKDRSEPAEELIRGFVRTTIESHLHDDPRLLRIMLEQAPLLPELLEKVNHHERVLLETTKDLLDQHPDIRVTDTDTASRLVVNTVELVVHRLIAEPDPVDATRLENELVAMLTRYLTC